MNKALGGTVKLATLKFKNENCGLALSLTNFMTYLHMKSIISPMLHLVHTVHFAIFAWLMSTAIFTAVFVIGKYILAPVTTVPISRLKLTAAVLSVKLDKLKKRELNLTSCRTDSTAVLYSICNSKQKFPVFVANRLSILNGMVTLLNGDTFHQSQTRLI